MENPFMKKALKEARAAFEKGEIPVGAVIVKDGEIIASGHNLRETNQDALSHAEIEAIAKACRKLGRWRLSDCDIYVTLEPCAMCCGAIAQAKSDGCILVRMTQREALQFPMPAFRNIRG